MNKTPNTKEKGFLFLFISSLLPSGVKKLKKNKTLVETKNHKHAKASFLPGYENFIVL